MNGSPAQKQLSVPEYGLWISGRERPSVSGMTFERHSPYDGRSAGVFANGDKADLEIAVAAARKAFDEGSWPRSSARARYEVLTKVARIMGDNADAMVRSMVTESGKPATVARNELGVAIRTFEYYAGAALDFEGRAVTERVHDALALIVHEPVGVAGIITPWNFPILNPVVKIAPALAVGCCVVSKPSHMCSGPTVLLARYLSEAGLPDGVFNVVTSDIDRGGVVGQALAASPLVDKIAFTGSTRTGHAVMRTAAGTTKRVSLELGGKSANIVFEDAPLDQAALVSANAFCFNSGQQCSAGTRLLVQDRIFDKFVASVAENTGRQTLGDPADKGTTMGPLVSEEQFARVESYIGIGRQEGRLVVGGGRPAGAAFADSLFIEPTIFDGIDNASRLGQEEVFGPVLVAIPFKTEEEAIRIANASSYGLAGGVWSRSIDTAIRVAKGVRTGKMFVNSYNNAGIEDVPHGGYKDSGIGREQGPQGLDEFRQIKNIQIKLGA